MAEHSSLPHKEVSATPTTVLAASGAATEDIIRQLSPTQQAGMKLAWAVGTVILLVIVFVCVDWVLMVPARPPLQAPREVIDTYKELRAGAVEDASKLFDLIVAKALLPVFTAILGYIFGSREAAARGSGTE